MAHSGVSQFVLLATYYWGNVKKEYEMGGACGSHKNTGIRVIVLGRSRHGKQYNIKTFLKEIKWESVG